MAYLTWMTVGCGKSDHANPENEPVAAVEHDHEHTEACDHDHEHTEACDHDHEHDHEQEETHAHVHPDPTYKQYYAGFPGHKYAVEVVTNEETNVVTAYLTDAHYAPVSVAANEITLQYIVDSAPQSVTLAKAETASGEALRYTLDNEALKTLLKGDACPEITVSVEVDGVPVTATLKKFGK